MSTDEPFRTDYEFLKGVDYIFVSLDRNLSGEECHELAEKYFETRPNSARFPKAILSRHSDEHRRCVPTLD